MAIVSGDYAGLSRGKHCAKHMASGQWAERDDNGNLVLDKPGRWMLHTSDGFSRKATEYVVVGEDGEIKGPLGRRFSLVS